MGDATKIEALKAKWQDAREAERLARDEYDVARVTEKLREFAAMGGVIGATRVRRSFLGRPDMRCGPFVVTGARIEHGEARYTVAKLKKDGTASGANASPLQSIIILPEDNQ